MPRTYKVVILPNDQASDHYNIKNREVAACGVQKILLDTNCLLL